MSICSQSFSRRAEEPGAVVDSQILEYVLGGISQILKRSLVILSGNESLLKTACTQESCLKCTLLHLGGDGRATGNFCLALHFQLIVKQRRPCPQENLFTHPEREMILREGVLDNDISDVSTR